jgi:tRNA nucleotidyltransferase (CCA-adding enzyme)
MRGMELFLVGGYVRDQLLGVASPSKDKDYLVVGCESYNQLVGRLLMQGYKIGQLYEEKFTVRAITPDTNEWCDFVWARKDGEYIDGEMINCSPGSFEDDILRRDYTVNALAMNESGEVIDIVGGIEDINSRFLRCVGDPATRFREDPRRITRGIRFIVQFDLYPVRSVRDSWGDPSVVLQLANPKYQEKVKEELNKAFAINTLKTLEVLREFPQIEYVVFNNLRLNIQLTNKKL